MLISLEVSALAWLLAAAAGIVILVLRVSPNRLARWIALAYIEAFRNTPLLLQLFFLYFALPSLGLRIPAFSCGVLALGLYSAAFVAEALRSGIAFVPRGQLEAARSCGLTYTDAMRLVVLPQAISRMIPPLGNTTLNLIKNSSLVSAVSIPDILGTAGLIGARTFDYVPVFIAAALCYLALTTTAAGIFHLLELRFGR